MPFLPGGFADLTGYRLGDRFTVDSLTSRDYAGIPRWEVSCRYGHVQIVPHLKLAALVESKAPNNLQCTYAACLLSKSRTQSETASEFLKRERIEADRLAQAEAERLAQAQAEWAKERAKQVEAERLQREYISFWNHQLLAGVPESEIPSLPKWIYFSEDARRQILERCQNDPAAQWKFTK